MSEVRTCTNCQDTKDIEEFYKAPSCRGGRRSVCKKCCDKRTKARTLANPGYQLDTTKRWQKNNPEKILLSNARRRAEKLNVPFSIELEDVVIPDMCPYLDIPLFREGRTGHSPSLDRIIPALGYIKGNVEVISDRANRIKNDGTADEHEAIARRLRALQG